MDYFAAIRHAFQGEGWFRKTVTGILISIVPVLNFTLAGYHTPVTQDAARGQLNSLPEWKGRLGEYFLEGLSVWLARLFYLGIPFVAVFLLRWAVIRQMVDGDETFWELLPIIFGFICTTLIMLIPIILINFVLLAATLRHAIGEQKLRILFQFAENFRFLRQHFRKIFVAWVSQLVYWLLVMSIVVLIGLIPIIGQVIAFFL